MKDVETLQSQLEQAVEKFITSYKNRPAGKIYPDLSLLDFFEKDPVVPSEALTEEIDYVPGGKVFTEEDVDEAEGKLLCQQDLIIQKVLDQEVDRRKTLLEFKRDEAAAFTPDHLKLLEGLVDNPAVLVISWEIWQDIIRVDAFVDAFEAVSSHKRIMQGDLGRLNGLTVFTDVFRDVSARFIEPDTAYVLSGEVGKCACSEYTIRDFDLACTFGVELNPEGRNVAKFRFVQ